ncbi:oligosaccharide flippase family protein [Natronoarchaeum sp. GCM10025703]|uniref:oligosaccharide flippase family protein n=1 Tax=unclassified Natronoarchaeum TaxID=2620183 RepID=UPI003621AA34
MTEAGDVNHRWQVISGSIAQVAQLGIGFLTTVLIARLLSAEVFGLYFFLIAIITIADGPIVGFCASARKRFSETDAPQSELLGAVLLTIFAATLLYTTLFIFLADYLPESNTQHLPVMLAILFPFYVGSNIFLSLISATGKSGIEMWLSTARNTIERAIQIALILAGFKITGLITGAIIAAMLAGLAALYYLNIRPTIPSRATLRSMWEFARYSTFNGIVNKVASAFDKLLLGFVFATGAVGLYEVSLKLVIPALVITSSITAGLMPRISNLVSRGEDITEHISRNTAFTSILAIPVFFGALVFGETLVVTVFSSKYAGSGGFLIWLALANIGQTQASVHSAIVRGLDLPRTELKIYASTTLLNVVAGIALLYLLGPIGVAVATAFTFFTRWGLQAVVVREHAPQATLLPRPFFSQLFAGLCMYGVLLALLTMVPLQSWINVVLLVGAGAIIYSGTLFAASRTIRTTMFNLLERHY